MCMTYHRNKNKEILIKETVVFYLFQVAVIDLSRQYHLNEREAQ